MARPGTSARLREEIDRDREAKQPEIPKTPLDPAPSETPLDVDYDILPPDIAAEAEVEAAELPPLEAAPKPQRQGGIIPLILIAILGMAIGFAAVMLI